MFGLGLRKYTYHIALSQAKNIQEDYIEDASDLVAFIMGQNNDLQRRAQKGSVVITKTRKSNQGEEVIVAEKLELPISGDVEDFEQRLSKFRSKKPLPFEPIPEENVPAFQVPQKTQEETQPLSKSFHQQNPEEAGYAPVPDLHFEEEDTSTPSPREEVVEASPGAPEEAKETENSLKIGLSHKDQIIKAQEEEILRLRALVSEKTNKQEEALSEKSEKSEKTEEAPEEVTEEAPKELSEDFPRLLPKDRPVQTKNSFKNTLHSGNVDQKEVTREAIELMNQAKRGMQPRDVIEYQVAVEFEATKQREIKEAEEQAVEVQKNKIAQARKQFEEKQKEITTKSNIELRKTKATIEQKFKDQMFEEVNARMQKQKEYIESFTADLSKKMMQYIENGSNLLEKES
ncbi:hypothetical protein [Lactococcus petauri]|uniref:hypothetical protein n=1 Tax=Lactococcus petauri TaxID=1940789 RepID=UPI001F5ADB64|nr:hypothetical protein [Lactococcus petauri]